MHTSGKNVHGGGSMACPENAPLVHQLLLNAAGELAVHFGSFGLAPFSWHLHKQNVPLVYYFCEMCTSVVQWSFEL